MLKAEIGIMQLQAKEYQRFLANHQKLGRVIEGFLYSFQRAGHHSWLRSCGHHLAWPEEQSTKPQTIILKL